MKYPVYATPRNNLFVSADYSFSKFRFMLSSQFIDHLDSDPSTTVESFETYTLLNSKISYQVVKWGELFISAENLLNQKYETNRYYTMPGVTLFGGFKIRL